MANKARPPMTKPEEVIAWAEETKAGNGEAFTMLKKEEQLLIARFILAMRDHIKALQGKNEGSVKDMPPTQTDQTPEQTRAETQNEGVEVDAPDPSLQQTNMEYFKANNVSMTRAYQLYCTWRNCDPDNRTVFDDERKAWLKAAGFAFWLNLPHQ